MLNSFPPELLEMMADRFAMLADATRLAILRCLMEGEKNVGQIVQETERGQANVSKHLRLLTDCGLVARRKEGLQVFYQIADPLVEKLCHLVCTTLLEQLKEDATRQQDLWKQLHSQMRGRK